jgi:hypothetical protein
VVTTWRDTVISVKHYPHRGTLGHQRHVTTRGETVVAGACLVAGGVVLGPLLGRLLRRWYQPQVVLPTRRFSVGEEPHCDVWIGPECLGGQSQVPLVQVDDHEAHLALQPGLLWELPAGVPAPLPDDNNNSTWTLPPGQTARLEVGEFTFHVTTVVPEPLTQVAAPPDWSTILFTGISLLLHGALLALFYFVPPDPQSLSLDLLQQNNRFVRYALAAPTFVPPEHPEWMGDQATPDEGREGRAHDGPAGAMGDPESSPTKGRYAVQGPANNPSPQLPREMAREQAQKSGILSALTSLAPSSPWGQDGALGADPENALGALLGSSIGQNVGAHGLGHVGSGRGGGGDGRGTIGFGNHNTVGSVGRRGGHGLSARARGRLPSRRSRGPVVSTGTASVRGSLSKETIRRHIRRYINSIRYCYESQLQRRPDLAGRVQVQFVISDSGSVSSSHVASSTLDDATAEQCVARAVQRIAFPRPSGGGVVIVTYPFMFQSADQAR